MATVDDEMFDHSFDGIREYNNPLPPWWVYLFLGTIIWAGLYLYYYHISGMGAGSVDEYTNEVKTFNAKYASLANPETNVDWKNPNFTVVTDQSELTMAKDLFAKNCVACHGPDGQGGIGPNLTDNYWINGGGINNIARTIALGVPEKGMITWKNTFKKKEILALASYVLSLNGTNPPNPKPPQGTLYEDKK